MEYSRISAARTDRLWELLKAYKAAIGEPAPSRQDCDRLTDAIRQGQILFYGAWDDDLLVGCCSVTVGFSTFK